MFVPYSAWSSVSALPSSMAKDDVDHYSYHYQFIHKKATIFFIMVYCDSCIIKTDIDNRFI